MSTCRIESKPGLILVEAKAHHGEAKEAGKDKGNVENDKQIRAAVQEANGALNGKTSGWQLSCDSHYQLCNRFAWAWKLSALGVPTVLVYLGFLRCSEMSDQGQPFSSAQEWSKALRKHVSGVVPATAWECRLQTAQAPMWASIRSLDLQWAALTPGPAD